MSVDAVETSTPASDGDSGGSNSGGGGGDSSGALPIIIGAAAVGGLLLVAVLLWGFKRRRQGVQPVKPGEEAGDVAGEAGIELSSSAGASDLALAT